MQKRQFRILRCAIAGIDAVEAETRHVFQRHTHENFGIGVIHRGAQKSLSGRGMVEAGAGDVITVNPGEVHDGAPIGNAGRAWRMLYLDPALIAAASLDISDGKTAEFEFSLPVIRDAGVAAGFARLFGALTADRATEAGQEEALLLLLARVVGGQGGGGRAVPQAVSRARMLIDDDPAAPLTLADLARESGLSRFQMVRAFAKATGLTPHAYLVQRRIDTARRLIAGGATLAEAALASGFADQSHMTRTFVRKYGVSPGVYAGAMA
ncbi:AraC family transcriptional regulator [Mesorhizobium sp. ZC-5]|uniref:AraC family transcriptional regulator n=1 Tax=Mesorhizobium sp. ZC-5 TaxID=2986066 RepID=UPI0021E829A8|nr:AraC family transcriptional regulator [Mesorhizobium sp. ZC-5]MCV3240429.1 AraC family transcriptional regulator [Mesorhizobium sp. ZC-5]